MDFRYFFTSHKKAKHNTNAVFFLFQWNKELIELYSEISNRFLQQVALIVIYKYVLITLKRPIHYSKKFNTNKIPTTTKQITLLNTLLNKTITQIPLQ